VDYVKPEQVKAFELGYRSFIEGFSVDVNGYYNIYNDFIGNLNVVAPLYGTAQDSPSGIPSADPGFQSVHALQTVILEHFNCTLILKWKLSHLVLV
jgi:outer membrane receptor protein involved in Fe transport